MTERELTYKFLNLPYVKQLRILTWFDLIEEKHDGMKSYNILKSLMLKELGLWNAFCEAVKRLNK